MRQVFVIVASALCLTLPLGACDSSPESQVDRALAQMEAQEPIFALIRENEPAAYQDMRALIERTMRQGGSPNSQDLVRRSREILARTIERRMLTAPDELVRDLITFIADQAAHLESNPTVCADLLKGTAGDIRQHVPPEMQQRERKLYEDLLKLPPRQQAGVATEAQAAITLDTIITDAQSALGLSADQVAEALNHQGPPLQVCRASGHLMRRISQLPAAEGAALFRFLAQQAAREARPPSPLN